MRCLITGVAGFLGSHLAARLVAAEQEVVGIDLVHPQDAWRIKGLPVEYHWQSLDGELRMPACDAVVHCAATTDVRMAGNDVRNATHVNVIGVAALLNQIREREWDTHFIQISTHSVYGKPSRDGGFREDDPPIPTNVYGATKAAQEQLALSFWGAYELPVTVLRMSLMYGERERAGALMSTFIRKALTGEIILLEGGGEQSRDFQYVGNAVDGIELVLRNAKTYGEIFNITSGEDITIKRIAEESVQRAGIGQTKYAPAREGEEGALRLDGAKARRVLGYKAAVKFAEGFERTYRWVAASLGKEAEPSNASIS